MNPYEKDSNGQAASPINTAISGNPSPFWLALNNSFNFVPNFRPVFLRSVGPERPRAHAVAVRRCALCTFLDGLPLFLAMFLLQMLPASMLLQPQLNLYFADFYCNTKPHYVTVGSVREGRVEICRPILTDFPPPPLFSTGRRLSRVQWRWPFLPANVHSVGTLWQPFPALPAEQFAHSSFDFFCETKCLGGDLLHWQCAVGVVGFY